MPEGYQTFDWNALLAVSCSDLLGRTSSMGVLEPVVGDTATVSR